MMENTISTRRRDPVVDVIRGIGILLVVVGHSGTNFWRFIYLFHMPLFIMLSGYLYRVSDLKKTIKNKVVRLWVPFVAFNTFFTIFHNLFLKLHYISGNADTTENGTITLKDVVGRTIHWCLLDGGTQLGGVMWFFKTLFQVSIMYAIIDLLLKRWFEGDKLLFVQTVFAFVTLWAGWMMHIRNWNPWGMGIVCSSYILYHLGVIAQNLHFQLKEKKSLMWLGAVSISFAILLILNAGGGIVLLGENTYPNPMFLLLCSIIGWVYVYSMAQILVEFPAIGGALAFLGRHTIWVAALHFLAFKLVTTIGLMISGGDVYCRETFPFYFTGSLWPLVYTVVGVAFPLLSEIVWQKACGRLIQVFRRKV